jgi:FtsK/SpoIIIE family
METSILVSSAPPPLEPLSSVTIHPDNADAEARQSSALALTRKDQSTIRRQMFNLAKTLDKAQYPEKASIRDSLRKEIQPLHEEYQGIRYQLRAAPNDEALQAKLAGIQSQLNPYVPRWQQLQHDLSPWDELARQHDAYAWILDNHQLAIERERVERIFRQRLMAESKIYEHIIRNVFTRAGHCYRYSVDNKEYVDEVSFSEVSYGIDAHMYKVAVQAKTAMGGWKDLLPRGVQVQRDLCNPDTLNELSIACQRQVTATININGAWIVVHRLSSYDGIVNRVKFAEVMKYYPAQSQWAVPVCMGAGTGRKLEWIHLADFPHALVAGSTGTGKSNFVNSVICTLISHHSPDEVQIALIDLKGGLEFSHYENVPHVYGKPVRTIEDVEQLLSDLEAIMNDRFDKFRTCGVKLLDAYRVKNPMERLPRIFVCFDEVASVMDKGESSKRIYASLSELVRKGRAVGINIWLSTQRPDVKALPGDIKANLSVRITGALPTASDSLTILGSGAARTLANIPGRMFLQYKGPEPRVVQTPYLSEDDFLEVMRGAAKWPKPPPTAIPAGARVIHQQWTPERVALLSVQHLDGNISTDAIHKELKEDMSRERTRKLVEAIWEMGEITLTVDDVSMTYKMERLKGKQRRLVKAD